MAGVAVHNIPTRLISNWFDLGRRTCNYLLLSMADSVNEHASILDYDGFEHGLFRDHVVEILGPRIWFSEK